jgi:SAM-dependent MidA family methyltransferase
VTLAALLRDRIAAEGPIGVADYMALCLGHPEHGYYMTRDPFGAAGDFTTAPEVSQMFGELVGLALALAWEEQGRPDPFVLAELGPGRGTLMMDALRATRRVPGFHAAARLWLVEMSPVLRAAQAARLAPHAPIRAERFADLPDAALFLVANEFFDALPVRQFLRTHRGWQERQVALAGDGRLRFAARAGAPPPRLGRDAPEGTVVELCPAGEALAGEIGTRLAARGGLALVIDYGAWQGSVDTLQAVSRHRHVDPLADPGGADLTAHVTFSALVAAATANLARAFPLVTLGEWLMRLGIGERAEALARAAPARREEIMGQLDRLTGHEAMGRLFKVLALTGPGAPVPPGFAAP